MAKPLPPETVQSIRDMLEARKTDPTITTFKIGLKHGVSMSAVARIRNGSRHAPRPARLRGPLALFIRHLDRLETLSAQFDGPLPADIAARLRDLAAYNPNPFEDPADPFEV